MDTCLQYSYSSNRLSEKYMATELPIEVEVFHCGKMIISEGEI